MMTDIENDDEREGDVTDIKLGDYIQFDDDSEVVAKKTFVSVVANQVRTDTEIRTMISEALLFTPAQIKSLGIKEIDVYLMMIPKALIYYQDAANSTQNSLAAAQYKFDDIIVGPSYNLTRDDFPKGTNNITEKMRLAKMRSLFPKEYNQLVAAIRKFTTMSVKLEGHIKHLQTLNDNLKKIRESVVFTHKQGE